MKIIKAILWAVIAAIIIITGWSYLQNKTETNKTKETAAPILPKTKPPIAVKVLPKTKPSIYAKPSVAAENPLYNTEKIAREQVEIEEQALDLSTPASPTASGDDGNTAISVAPTISGLESREPQLQGVSIKLKGSF
ncbi:MAG: hypothetical protein HQL70_06745 [Magnetococcales bacterium]|nr:hypothetical protein [Magnetococcales bacterium]